MFHLYDVCSFLRVFLDLHDTSFVLIYKTESFVQSICSDCKLDPHYQQTPSLPKYNYYFQTLPSTWQ